MKSAAFVILAVVAAIVVANGNQQDPDAARYLQQAKSILNSVPLIDGHNDLMWRQLALMKGDFSDFDMTLNQTTYLYQEVWPSHTDIPRLRAGGMGTQIWSIFSSCKTQYKDGPARAMMAIDLAKRMVDKYSDTFQFVTTVDGILDAKANNKIGSMMGLEGGHMISNSKAVLRIFYELGIRYMTLTWNCNTPWADMSSPDKDKKTPKNGGLSPWGKEVVKEMNRLGMMVDLSHVSPDTMRDAIATSRAPIIYSHSSVFALCPNYRNVPDDVMLKVKDNEGIIMINFYSHFINCTSENWDDYDVPRPATLNQVVDHMDYIKNKIGADYIGIGGDYDGVDVVPRGLEDVSKYPDLLARMLQRGWTEAEVKKVVGENFIRVFRKVEEVRDQLASEQPSVSRIPEEDIPDQSCMNYNAWNPLEEGHGGGVRWGPSQSLMLMQTVLLSAICFTMFS